MTTSETPAETEGPGAATASVAYGTPLEIVVYRADTANDFRARPPADHAEEEWRARLRAALGSRSDHFVDASLSRVIAVCKLPGQCCPTTTSVSAAIAVIESLHPENEIQTALAVHIACLDAASGNMLARLTWGGTELRTKIAANAIGKLERAFQTAITTYYRLKHGNKQVIRIERLEIQAGAQAVVGQVISEK